MINSVKGGLETLVGNSDLFLYLKVILTSFQKSFILLGI